ncbi:MAG: hypothetical protein FWF91_06605 [Coriobacteriia bacterium]|nr:hypothetical protein [Coriobacteriia bacterium]
MGDKGQAAVEMAVVMPVLLAVVGIAINLMVCFGDCARFDRIAAEAVRTQAASPGFGEYGTTARAQRVQGLIEEGFSGSDHLSFSVSISGGGSAGGGGEGITLSLAPQRETVICTLYYRPWGFGDSFFGVEFSGIPHTRQYVIDPYKPGVLF